jgi:hypothetical protein
MAQSLRLKRFTNVALLKRFSFPLLMELFESAPAFKAFMAARGIALVRDADVFDFDALARVLMSPDVDTPEELLDALYFVDNLADPECSDRILEECVRANIDLGGTELSPEDLALKAWLASPNILQRIHAEQYRTRPEKFESYFAGRADNLEMAPPATSVLTALEADLNEWFDFKKKGRGARVFPFPCEDAVWFLVRHGQRIKREGTVEADQKSGSVFYRPEKFDVLIYYPATGELAVHTETKGERRTYCRCFGKHLFGDPTFFRFENPVSKYTLNPLVSLGRAALVCSDVSGIEDIALVELHIERDSDQTDVEVRRADDVLRALEDQGRNLADEAVALTKAKFRVRFTGGKERTVVIEPPNAASFDRESDNAIIHEWLSRRGFIVVGKVEEAANAEPDGILATA